MHKLDYFSFENINLEFKLHEASEPINQISFLADYMLIIGGINGVIQKHNLSQVFTQKPLLKHTTPITAIGCNEDFITADSEGNIICWDGLDNSVINQININKFLGYSPTAIFNKQIESEKINIQKISILPQYHLAYLIPNKVVMMPIQAWDYQTNELKYVGGAEQYPCGGTSIVANKDGEYIVWTSGPAMIILSVQSGKIIRQIGKAEAYGVKGTREILIPINNHLHIPLEGHHSGRINSVDLSPNGKYLITGSEDRSIRIWDFFGLLDLSRATPIRIFNTQYPIDFVHFISPSTWVAASLNSGNISSGDLETISIEDRFNKEKGPIGGIAVSPSRNRIAAWYKNKKMLIWFLE